MPFRVRWIVSNQIIYLGKNQHSTYDERGARVFGSMGAIKNSLAHWHDLPEDTEIEEVELKPTGKILLICEVMESPQARRLREALEREERRLAEVKTAELAELKRLKEKYPNA